MKTPNQNFVFFKDTKTHTKMISLIGLILISNTCVSQPKDDIEFSTCEPTTGQMEIPESTEARRSNAIQKIRLMPQNAQIVTIGDSLISGWPPDLLTLPEKYKSSWNFGYPGDTTGNVLWRLAQAPLKNLSPEKILILIGTNNLNEGQSACSTLAGINKIIQAIKSNWPHSKIAVISIPPRGRDNIEYLPQRTEINSKLNAASKKGRVFEFIQLPDSKLVCTTSSTECEFYQKDYLHLNRSGYSILNQYVQKFLEQ